MAALVANGIRQAILSGRFKAGAVLPNREAMSEMLGVSVRAIRGAISRLAEEGLVVQGHKSGCVVQSSGARVWRGRVLYIGLESAQNSYYESSFLLAFRRRLATLNILLDIVTFSHDENGALRDRDLSEALLRPIDVVVLGSSDRDVCRIVSASKLPFLWMCHERPGRFRPAHCVAKLENPFGSAIDAFVRHCVEAHVGRVVQFVPFENSALPGIDLALRAAGIPVRTIRIGLGEERPEKHSVSIRQRSMMKVFETFETGKIKESDLLLFRDDGVALGGLVVLLRLGIDVPGTVRVVTLSNRGDEPVYPKTLSCLRYDPFRLGETMADRVDLCFKRRPVSESLDGVVEYVRGETFP